MSAAEAARKEALFAAASGHLGEAEWACFVPGRVELLGKHTDYAGGRSLLCTVERGFCFLARERSDSEVHVVTAATGSRAVFNLSRRADAPASGWQLYPAAVVNRLARDFGLTGGLDLAFASDLPPAAGLSSSSALTVGVFLALATVNGLQALPAFRAALPDLPSLAGYLGAVENGKDFGPFPGGHGVGTLGGSQDQTAILCSIPGEIVQFSFDPVRFERRIPFPTQHRLVIGATGVVAEKTGAANRSYNAAAEAVHEIERRWRLATGRNERTLAAAVECGEAARRQLRALVEGEPWLRARLDQFITESTELIPAAGDALASGALGAFGTLVDRSQEGAEQGLRNQTAETIELHRSARTLGAVAASAFGAGFGGSVWVLAEQDQAEEFKQRWSTDYQDKFPQHADKAEFFTSRSGPCALSLV